MINTTRKTRRPAWRLLLIPALCALVPAARAQDQSETEIRERTSRQMRDGLWLSDRMMENFITRSTMEVTEKFNLREDQRQYLEQSSRARWPKFMKENRGKLQPLINGFFEKKFSPTPPSPEEMQEWAKDAREMLDAFRDEIHEQQMDFREILEPEQKQIFDKDMMKFQLGMEAVDTKFKNWEEGYFHPKDMGYQAPTNDIQKQVDAMPIRNPPGEGEAEDASDPGAPPIDAWYAYFDSFDKKYQLDDGQYNRGHAIYVDFQKRASLYRSRKRSDYDRLERVPLDSRDAEWQRKMNELDTPLNEMFREFNERLFGLLTTKQREIGNSK